MTLGLPLMSILDFANLYKTRTWAEKVKSMKNCAHCGYVHELHAHHIVPISILIERYDIRNYYDVLDNEEILFDINNGLVLCMWCHCEVHERQITTPKPFVHPGMFKDKSSFGINAEKRRAAQWRLNNNFYEEQYD